MFQGKTRADSQAMSVLCPHKQRAAPQREQPYSGKTDETAAASPADSNQIKKYVTVTQLSEGKDCKQIVIIF